MAKLDTKKSPETKSLKDQIIEAALALAETMPWRDVQVEDILQTANIVADDFYEYFDDKGDVLSAYGRCVDRRILSNVSTTADGSLSAREQLFDLLMERFDILNENRDAILSILNSMKGDPKQAIVGLPHLARSMSRMLEATGEDTNGLRGAGKVTGLVSVYLYALRVWKEDDSPDMGKTMAAVDKALDYAEQAANSCNGEGGITGLSESVLNGFQDILGRFAPSRGGNTNPANDSPEK